MSGLWKMVMLRGASRRPKTINSRSRFNGTNEWYNSLNSLAYNCYRTDLCGAFLQDVLPHFPLSASWLEAINVPPGEIPFSTTSPSSISTLWEHELPNAHAWISIFNSISHLLSEPDVPTNIWMEAILHRLLSLRPLQIDSIPPPEAIIEEVCRIGTLLFLAPLWCMFGVHPVRTAALRHNLLAILHSYFTVWGELRVVLVWVLMHAAREVETELERGEFVMRLAMVASKLRKQSWETLLEVVKSVMWIEHVGEKHWDIVRIELQKFFPVEVLQCESFIDFYTASVRRMEEADPDAVTTS